MLYSNRFKLDMILLSHYTVPQDQYEWKNKVSFTGSTN